MSTENEGAAATPAEGPPTQDAAAPGTPAGTPAPEPSAASGASAAPGPAPGEDEDFALARPDTPEAPPAGTGAPAEHTTRLPRIDPDAPPPASTAAPAPGGTPADPLSKGAPARDADTTQLPPVPPHAAPPAAPGAGAPAAHAAAGHGTPPPPPPPGGGYGGSTPPGPPGPAGAAGSGPGAHGAHGGPGGPQGPWGAPPAPPPHGGKRRGPGLVIAAVLAAALVAGGIGGGIGFWAAESSDSSPSSTTISAEAGSESRDPDSVAGIAQKTLPSVVTIETSGGGESGTGTGFVFDEQGHILTNNHVVASAADGGRLTATFSDGKQYDAEIVGRAEGYDIAVIKLEDAGDRELNPLPLGNSEKIKVGDTTLAIGAPYGLSGTVTTGIVSAKNRPVASSDGQGSEASYMNALQTDASINPGNSGGPLLDGNGAVIGVNSAIQSGGGGGLGSGSAGSIGLGFAIPIDQAERVATQLIETGVPVYPVIGVRVATGQQGQGAVIAERVSDGEPVTPDGPADKAGIEPGDVITKFDDTRIDSSPTLIATIWAHEPGETVEITYVRDGERQTTDITLGSRKGDS